MAQTSQPQCGDLLLLKIGNGLAGNAVTFTASSDLVGLTAHGLAAGDKVKFATVVTSTAPVVGTEYFVLSSGLTADAFKIALTAGGTPINIDSDGTGTMAEVFVTMAGMTSNSISGSAEEVDITSKDDSHNKTLLSGCGTKSFSASGEGVFKDENTFNMALRVFQGQYLRNFRVYINSAGDYWEGAFKITALEKTGDHNDAIRASITLASSGAVVLTRS